jgi:hypothetical protein
VEEEVWEETTVGTQVSVESSSQETEEGDRRGEALTFLGWESS